MPNVQHTPVPPTTETATSSSNKDLLMTSDDLHTFGNKTPIQASNPAQGQTTSHATCSKNDKKDTEKSPNAPSSQNKNNCLVCNNKNNRWMVCCDVCEQWYHYKCVGVNDSIRNSEFVCNNCQKETDHVNTSNKVVQEDILIDLTNKTSKMRSISQSSRKTQQNALSLALIEEEHQLRLKAADEDRRIEKEYARKCLEANYDTLKKRMELMNYSGSDSGSSVDRSSLTKRWVKSQTKSLVTTNKTREFIEPEKNFINYKSLLNSFDPENIDINQSKSSEQQRRNILSETSEKIRAGEKQSMPCEIAQENGHLKQSYEPMVSENHHKSEVPQSDACLLTSRQIQARFAVGKNDLPDFSGDPNEWPLFISTYERTTKRCGYSNEDNLERLMKSLKGEARKKVRGRLNNPNTVPSIIDTLRRRYGNPTKIIDQLIMNVEKIPKIRFGDPAALEDLSTSVEDLVQSIECADISSELENRSLIRDIVLKLPFDYQMKWTEYAKVVSENKMNVNLATLNRWLQNIADTVGLLPYDRKTDILEKRTKPRYEKQPVHRVAAHDVKTTKSSSASGAISNDQGIPKCPVCSASDHKINECQKFVNMEKSQRWNVVTNKNLCRSCLKCHHTKNCTTKKICGIDGCDKIHHQMLHSAKRLTQGTEAKPNVDDVKTVVESVNHHMNIHDKPSSILYRILPVTLFGKNKFINTYAFMDEGSSTTLLERDIANYLDLVGPENDICIKWTSDVKRIEKSSKIVNLNISAFNSTKQYQMKNVRTVDSLNLPIQTIDDNSLNHKHLKKLPINKFNNGKPTILIGMDYYKLCVPLKVREGKDHAPVATKTRLGWLLAGPLAKDISIRINIHNIDDSEDNDLHKLVKNFFSVENMGITAGIKPVESDDNIRALEVLESTTKLSGDRFETGLIWKHRDVNLPESRKMAMKRMICLEKKLANDEPLRKNVQQQITEYIRKGYARKLSDEEAVTITPTTWYLPIFTVRNPNKPAKVRLVWDAAAKSNGVALNDMLLKGPDMLNPLQGVLMRFREKPFAVGGDLEQMFHKVKIIKQDHNSQRFLWRDDPQKPPDTYVMQVMTFGATCSPTSAQYVLHQNSSRFSKEAPRAVIAIQQNHYVDDWLDSFGTVEEARHVVHDVRKIHGAGGFPIHNWVSNSSEILADIKQENSVQKNLTNLNDAPVERVLGMHWRTTDDKFIFVINRNRLDMEIIDGEKVPTKRQVLSTVMSTFDPLGLIASYVIYAKALLQDIWRSGVDWDDHIKTEHYQKWKLWTSQFKSIEKLEINRCYSSSWDEMTTYEVHIFVDASEAAYAATSYVCSISNGNRECALIMSKTRVAPNKPTSIPRLELLSAVLGARLWKTIESSHSIKFTKKYFWTDSRTVLSWLNSDARNYRQFVALRIAEILDSTELSDWRWVPSQSNVADEATKWSAHQTFQDNSRWYNGPKFLLRPQDEWPIFEKVVPNTEEEIRTVCIHSVVDVPTVVVPNEDNFSTWEKLRHITTTTPKVAHLWVLKYRKRKPGEIATFTPETAQTSERKLFIKAQQLAYDYEIQTLKQGKAVGKTSTIFNYSPYMDKDGLIRMRGRIDNAVGIMHDSKRPIILPNDSRITFLYVDFFHRKYLHQNHDIVLNEVRQRVVIPKLRSLLKKVRKYCQKCKILTAKAVPPEMGQLPSSRLQMYSRPFSYTGVDYFGPLEVIDGRKVLKRYGVLFTCMTSRAIHLEMSYSLSTNSCIMVLEKFMARRGTPLEITSDNATNFRGASKELRNMIKNISSKKLSDTYPDIVWIFIPPSSPHFGGTWERLIRTVKSNLKEVVMVKRPTDEMLTTFLTQVENIVNSRPLTEVPIDDASSEAITPNHLIHGTSSGVKPFFEKTLDDGLYVRQWLTVEQMCNSFWSRFVNEYIPTLNKRSKWYTPAKPLSIGDVVIVVDDRSPRNNWQKGIIIDVNLAKDGQTRSAVVKTTTGLYTRPTVKLAVLDLKSKQPHPEGSALTGGDC